VSPFFAGAGLAACPTVSVAAELQKLGGTATWAQLRAVVNKRALLTAVRDGSIVKVSRGLYSLPTSVDRSTARRLRGVVSHLSAAETWELGVLKPVPVLHVTVSRNRSRVPRPVGVKIHYGDITSTERQSGATNALRTVVDCARTCPIPQGLAIADTAVRTGLVTALELRRAVAPLRGAGVVKARRVAGWVDARAASPLESALRGLLLDNGFTQFEPQLAVVHDGRRVATVDLGDPATGLLLEADSFLWHGQRAALERDARRYDELVSRGFLVLRFTWEQILSDRAWVLAMVRRALARPDRQDGSLQVTS
jgi:very-short-patch-repair endonuclease